MLTRPLPSLNRITAGFALSLGLGLAFAGLAWAQQAPRAAGAAIELPRPEPMVLSEPPAGDNTEVAYRHMQPPRYPAESIQLREEGEALIKIEVTTDGTPAELAVHLSSGSERLDRAALEAVAQWHFHPAKRDGRPVSSHILTPIRFSLDDSSAAATASVTPASYARLSPPEYPASAKAAGLEGTTLLRVGIDTDGRVLTVDIEASAGAASLDEAAAKAVEGWTFNPARLGEQAIRSQVRVPVQFLAANSTLGAFEAPPGALDTITLRAQ